MKELIVSTISPGVYERVFAEHLGKTLDALKLSSHIIPLPTGRAWLQNINDRWLLVRALCDRMIDVDILCIDADMELRENPWPLLQDIRNDCDFGACIMRGLWEPKSLLGAVIFLPAGPRRIGLLDAWIAANTSHSKEWDQVNLQGLMGQGAEVTEGRAQPQNIDRFITPGSNYKHATRGVRYFLQADADRPFCWAWLPVEYGTPFDRAHRLWMPRGIQPIIEHYHVGADLVSQGKA